MQVPGPQSDVKRIVYSVRVQPRKKIGYVCNRNVPRSTLLADILRSFLEGPICELLSKHTAVGIGRKAIRVNYILGCRHSCFLKLATYFVNKCGVHKEIDRIKLRGNSETEFMFWCEATSCCSDCPVRKIRILEHLLDLRPMP